MIDPVLVGQTLVGLVLVGLVLVGLVLVGLVLVGFTIIVSSVLVGVLVTTPILPVVGTPFTIPTVYIFPSILWLVARSLISNHARPGILSPVLY